MEEIGIVVTRGIGIGSVYSIIAFALNACFNATGVLNFAQGSLMVTGGIAFSTMIGPDSGLLAWSVALVLAGLIIAGVTAVQGAIVLKPLDEASHQWSWMVTTLASSVIIGALILLRRGPNATIAPNILGDVPVFGTRMPAAYPVAFGLSLLVYLGLRTFYRRTLPGLTLSAMAQDVEAAKANGVRLFPMQVIAFALSGLLLGMIGAAAAPVLVLDPFSGLHYVVNGFIAAVIGGLGRDLGALIGGPILGVLTMMTALYVGGQWQLTVSLAVLIMVLLAKPRGLFGISSVRTV